VGLFAAIDKGLRVVGGWSGRAANPPPTAHTGCGELAPAQVRARQPL